MQTKRRLGWIAWLAAVGSLAVALVATDSRAPAAGATTTPMSEVKEVIDQALAILRNSKAPLKQRQQALVEVVSGHFDFIAMSRSAIGYHWRDLNKQQRKDFTNVFTTFIEDAYLTKIQDYKGQNVELVKQAQDGPDYARVYSKIIQSKKDPIAVNYLLKRSDNGWKIYDVTVDDISIIANYRNQFNRVINNHGFNTLMTDLRKKQQELAATLAR